METTVGSIPSLIFSKKPVRGFPCRFCRFPRRFRHFPPVVSVVSLSFLLLFGRGDQELSKTFYGLKIGPLLRKLQAFKDWSFLGGFPRHFRHFPVVSVISPIVSVVSTRRFPRHFCGFPRRVNLFNPQKVLESSWSPLPKDGRNDREMMETTGETTVTSVAIRG